MFKRKSKNNITFAAKYPWMLEIPDIQPQPASKFIPQWWKDVPYMNDYDAKTVKTCPSFADVFSNGYVLPMWTDSVFRYVDGGWWWNTPNGDFSYDFHGRKQAVDYFPDGENREIFKAISPWYLYTDKGISIWQLPMLFNFDKKWDLIPGIIHTDIYHEINQHILIHNKNEEVFIKRGEPFALYVPFVRTRFKYHSVHQNEELYNKFRLGTAKANTKFSNGYRNEYDRIKEINE